MAYINFLDSSTAIPCDVIPQGKNIVSLKFHNSVVVDTSGFEVYLDEKKEYKIGDYKLFTTIYRNDEVTAEFNGYQLSNDNSVYIESEEPIDTTDTEELERQNKISELNSQIASLKQQLTEDDYKIIKAYEYALVGKETEYDIKVLHEKRELIRAQINKMELQLAELEV